MDARFQHPAYSGKRRAVMRNEASFEAPRPVVIGSACCCPARPVVRVTMPPTPARPHETELLLCGHHYRTSRQALDTAGATVAELAGAPEFHREALPHDPYAAVR